jgi:hypothetical protein
MVVTRKGFSQVVGNAFAGMGFPAEGPSVYEFPMEMFLPASDLSPIKENIDKIIYGLTKWQSKITKKGIVRPEMITVHGADYQNAFDNMNFLFLRNMWGDGLSITPVTEERVKWILTGTDLPRNKVVGSVLPRGGIATVETIAVNLAMAGGRPEYMPVLIAAVEGILDPASTHFHWSATTNNTYPAVVVNGPVAKQLRINSGYGCLGPDPQYPAGASIGRAIRLILQDAGGAIPGIGTMAIHGGASRYTNVVFAEDEAGIPKGWEPLNVSFWGYKRGVNTLTVLAVSSSVNVTFPTSFGKATPEEVWLWNLNKIAGFMGSPYTNYWQRPTMFEGSPGIVVLGRGSVESLADLGWSKEKVQQYLWENSKLPWADKLKYGGLEDARRRIKDIEGRIVEGQPWPITSKPKNIMIVVAGGAQSGHGFWMQVAQAAPTSAKITLPKNWDALLKEAEKDLGPIPLD